MDLSIIFGTYNRKAHLERCLASIARSLKRSRLDYEIVITDGGSTDGTLPFLEELARSPFGTRVRVLLEVERRGACAAFNAAYEHSTGRYVAVLNDDVEILEDALPRAVEILEKDLTVGQVAMGYKLARQHEGHGFRVFPIHDLAYANLGVIRRDVAELVVEIQGGLWNPRYHTYAADTELSCWVWKLGYTVFAAESCHCIDHNARDELRRHNNSGRNREDSIAFGLRWPSQSHILPDGPDPLVTEEELARFHAVRARIAGETCDER